MSVLPQHEIGLLSTRMVSSKGRLKIMLSVIYACYMHAGILCTMMLFHECEPAAVTMARAV